MADGKNKKDKPQKSNHKAAIICLLLGCLSFAVYARVIGCDFLSIDDNGYVTENQQVQAGITWESIKCAFMESYCANWHPVTWLSHMADCQMFGVNPWGHHLVNLLLHVVNVLLLFWVLKMMTGAVWRSAFVAAVFAVHPLNVESVAWVAERKNMLSTLFWILVMAGYWKYFRNKSAIWYAVTLVLFALGLMAKPMLVTLPFVLLLLDYWPMERIKNLKDWKTIGWLIFEKVPFFILSAISGVITFYVQRSFGAVMKIDLSIRLTNAMVSYIKYIWKMVWPSKLAVFYLLDDKVVPLKEAIAAGLLLIVITVLVIKLSGRWKYLAVGWFWYLGTMVPVIGLVQVGEQAMADRYAYVTLIGLFIIISWSAADILKKWQHQKDVLWTAAIIIIASLSLKTFYQAGYWKNGVTIFEYATRITKNNRRAYYSLGCAYGLAENYPKAIEAYREAIRLKPDFSEAQFNLGNTYNKVGNLGEAIKVLKTAIKLQPKHAEAHGELGAVYGKLGKYEESIEAFKKSIELKPDYANGYFNLGIAYNKNGEQAKAIRYLKGAISLRPTDTEAYFSLGVAYGQAGETREEAEAYRQAIKIKPDYPDAHYNLGIAYLTLGDKESAKKEYEQLKKLDGKLANMLLRYINK